MGQPKLTLTLDTNCIVAVDERRPESAHVLALNDAHRRGTADVAIAAIMASEKQKAGGYLHTFGDFQARLKQLGLDSLPHVLPMTYFDVSYWDNALLPSQNDVALAELMHQALFPSIPSDWEVYCAAQGIDPKIQSGKPWHDWRNALCDVQALWSHTHARREVFVTSDGNFKRRLTPCVLSQWGAGRIATPAEAAHLVSP